MRSELGSLGVQLATATTTEEIRRKKVHSKPRMGNPVYTALRVVVARREEVKDAGGCSTFIYAICLGKNLLCLLKSVYNPSLWKGKAIYRLLYLGVLAS
jgi:hypothetical protein